MIFSEKKKRIIARHKVLCGRQDRRHKEPIVSEAGNKQTWVTTAAFFFSEESHTTESPLGWSPATLRAPGALAYSDTGSLPEYSAGCMEAYSVSRVCDHCLMSTAF